jgi:hypothetical protein
LREVVIYYGMKMNVEETKVMRMSRKPSPVQTVIDKKQMGNVKFFNYFVSVITNDARCTREIKSRIVVANQCSTGRRLFTSKLDLNVREKLVNSYIWSVA